MTGVTRHTGSASSLTQHAHDLYALWLRELWHGDYTDIDALIDDEFVGSWPGNDVRGRAGLRGVIEQTRAIVGNIRFEIVAGPLAEHALVGARWTGRGEAGGSQVTFAGNDILRIRAGRVVEYWVESTRVEAN